MTRKILIFRIGHFGDTVVALPALWAIRRHYPDAKLTLLTNHDRRNRNYVSPADVLPSSGLIDNVIAYPNDRGFGSFAAFASLALQIRRANFDELIYLMPRVRSERQIMRDRKFFRTAGISELRGSEFLLHERLDPPDPSDSTEIERESDFLLRMAAEIDIPVSRPETDLSITKDEAAAAIAWLSAEGLDRGDQTLIAVAPGSKVRSKMWPEDRFIEVLGRLIQKFDCHPIIFGGPEDRDLGNRLISSIGKGSNAAGSLGIRADAALLQKCHLYLGNDTGTMHLASAAGVSCVAMFSRTEWNGRWSPFGENDRLFRSTVPCADCAAGDTVGVHACMEAISADEVFDACSEILSN